MAQTYTHLRVRMIGKAAILAGLQFRPGEVVALEDLKFKPETWDALSGQIEETGNQHPVVEAGTLADGAFVPWEVKSATQPNASSATAKVSEAKSNASSASANVSSAKAKTAGG